MTARDAIHHRISDRDDDVERPAEQGAQARLALPTEDAA